MGSSGRKWKPASVADNHHPLMHWFWDQWLEHKRTRIGKKPSQQDFMTKTGLAKNSMTSWKRCTMPTIGNFEAACNAL